MKKKCNILVFPGGTESGLEIWRSLKDIKEVILFSASSDVTNHAPFTYKRHFIVPDITDKNWIDVLNSVITENNIDYVFPAHDYVIEALNENRGKINTDIISSPKETCSVIRSKSATYSYFQKILPVPTLYNTIDEVEHYPVFVKPDKGYGSQNAQKIDSKPELKIILERNPELIISEFLPGKEYTIDCFSDREAGLLFCSGRERRRIRMGTSMNSTIVDDSLNSQFSKYAQQICSKLNFYGAWFFQMKYDQNNQLKLLEISTRIAGTMAMHRVLGVNFPLLSIFEQKRERIDILVNKFPVEIDRSLTNRYKPEIQFSKIYVDLDDTLIIHDKINCQLLLFLYQSVNRGCKIILISKCLENIDEVLKKWKIGQIFDQVIWLKEGDKKSDFIEPDGAIFIDDSFSQRREVQIKHNIPTFDNSMIEFLIQEMC